MTVAKSIVPALAAWAATGWFVAGHPAPALAGQAGSDAGGRLTSGIAAEPASGVRGHPASGVATVRPPGPGEPTASGPYGQVVHEARQGPGVVCAYRLRGVRKGGFLNVRESAGVRHAPVGKLRPADGGFSGACTATNGWIAVKTAAGTSGFAAARYLHRLDLSGRPSLSCIYRLRHVREGSFLNVREGAGIRHARVGKLRPAGGNIAGACDATHGWVAVDSADGIPGWASAHYLRRM
ncbi:SH3 domain-containing protein [Microbispora catharanthi]|uniref:SH3 domain-containing protein n=1 Tax=Microbispora catharanthi TaxID=1712871 RepID=A0A5N6BLU3_9ACTN|nr:SH3 domain-containing protein [Microbispora catharanthi]KAB8180799.1 hypothetical protein FH610_031505 [Microbispora catharanthi]